MDIKRNKKNGTSLNEKRLHDILENVSDWVWELDLEGNFIFVSGNIEKILGYSKEEILKLNAFDLMSNEEASRVGDVFAQIVAEKRPFTDMLNINLHKDGTPKTILSSGVPVFDDQGELVGYRGADKDVTEKENIYRATAEGAQHILLNLLNQLQLVEYEINKNPSFDQEVAKKFSLMTDEAKNLVIRLGAVDVIEEHEIKRSYYPSNRFID
jgi:PAS domain S-box-containing protein